MVELKHKSKSEIPELSQSLAVELQNIHTIYNKYDEKTLVNNIVFGVDGGRVYDPWRV